MRSNKMLYTFAFNLNYKVEYVGSGTHSAKVIIKKKARYLKKSYNVAPPLAPKQYLHAGHTNSSPTYNEAWS